MISIFKSKASIQKEWKSKTIDYAKRVNSFTKKWMLNGWDNAGPESEAQKLVKKTRKKKS